MARRLIPSLRVDDTDATIPAQAPKPKKQAAKKRVIKDESEDEFEFDDEPAAPRAARGGRKAVNYAAIAGSDSEEDEWANDSDSDGFVGDDSD